MNSKKGTLVEVLNVLIASAGPLGWGREEGVGGGGVEGAGSGLIRLGSAEYWDWAKHGGPFTLG